MPKLLPDDLFIRVAETLARFPAGARMEELEQALAPHVSRRSLQRRLAEWVQAGVVRAEGVRKGRRYFLHSPSSGRERLTTGFAAYSVREREEGEPTGGVEPTNGDLPISIEGGAVRAAVRRPIFNRTPVGYQREFLERYEPNRTAYLPEHVARHLHLLGRTPDGERRAGTFAREIFHRLLIDLSWASSRLEGNTYSLLDTQRLIEAGEAAAGKDAKETQMILNHKAAIEFLVDSVDDVGADRFTVCSLHALLSDNLLDDSGSAGRIRDTPVGIAHSTYVPTAVPPFIEEMFALLLRKAAAIRDPLEQALFLMVHLPYLQPFVDANKRTSRLAANIPLIRSNLVPLSFVEVPERAYIDGLMGVYELNRVELLRDVFVWAYERSCLRYKTVRDSLPSPDPLRLRYRAALTEVIGEIVRRRLRATREQVANLAGPLVAAADMEAFVSLAIRELQTLHEGSIARHRLRPSEWARYRTRTDD